MSDKPTPPDAPKDSLKAGPVPASPVGPTVVSKPAEPAPKPAPKKPADDADVANTAADASTPQPTQAELDAMRERRLRGA